MMTVQEAQQLREDFRDDLAKLEDRLSTWLSKIDRKADAAAEAAAAARQWTDNALCADKENRIRALELSLATAKGARVPAFLGSMVGALIAGAGLIVAVLALAGKL